MEFKQAVLEILAGFLRGESQYVLANSPLYVEQRKAVLDEITEEDTELDQELLADKPRDITCPHCEREIDLNEFEVE